MSDNSQNSQFPSYPASSQGDSAGYAAPQQGYPAPQQPYYGPAKTNSFSIVSLVTAIVGVSIAGVIFGHIALKQIEQRGEQGKGMAIAGLIIGYIGCVGWIIYWILVIVWLSSCGWHWSQFYACFVDQGRF